MIVEQNFPTTKWSYFEEQAEVCQELSRQLSVSTIVSRVLINRGIDAPEKGKRFLTPSLNDMHNPNLMQDMQKGVERVIKALKNKEKITIYGDYDADGITSVALLLLFLRIVQADVDYYIPERISEGYGLNRTALEKLRKNGSSLLITVDCGISDHDEIAFANNSCMDVIVIDHHEVPEQLPSACAVINPMRSDCQFPFKQLAAVGIVFNFVVALRGAMRSEGFWSNYHYPNLKEYLDLVAIGTIGDIVPLLDENRTFIKIGMELLTAQRRIGIKALKEIAGLDKQLINISRASYGLIPRINASGRIANSDAAVELFLTDNITTAREYAQKLDSYNRKRQDIERLILAEIIVEINKIGNLDSTNVFVFASENWHPGVIGIVASRIVNRFSRPAFLISLKSGVGKGSGRSFAGIDIYQILKKCDSLLLSFGGHRNAAGISIKEEYIEKFSELMQESLAGYTDLKDFRARTIIDTDCLLADIDDELLAQLNLLAPFGASNPEPVLCVKGVHAIMPTIIGNSHLRMQINADNGTGFDCIWYNKCKFLKDISKNALLAVAFSPQYNLWKGQNSIQLKLHDIAPV